MSGQVDLSVCRVGDVGTCVDGCTARICGFHGVNEWPVVWEHAGGFHFSTTMRGIPRRMVEDDDNNTIVRVEPGSILKDKQLIVAGEWYGEVPTEEHISRYPKVGDKVVRIAFPNERATEVRTVSTSKRGSLILSPDDDPPIIAWLYAADCRLVEAAPSPSPPEDIKNDGFAVHDPDVRPWYQELDISNEIVKAGFAANPNATKWMTDQLNLAYRKGRQHGLAKQIPLEWLVRIAIQSGLKCDDEDDLHDAMMDGRAAMSIDNWVCGIRAENGKLKAGSVHPQNHVAPPEPASASKINENLLNTSLSGLQFDRARYAVRCLEGIVDDPSMNPRTFIVAALDGLLNVAELAASGKAVG